MIVAAGKGDLIWDVDGRQYIDFCGSWGPLILGHAHPALVAAAAEQLGKGFSFGISTESEEKMATEMVRLVPSLEKVRFVNSGTEATMTALRIARGATGRAKIVKFAGHYHGHSDALLVQAGSGVHFLNGGASSLGVPSGAIADTLVLPFNDEVSARAFFDSAEAQTVAAVIVEPIAGNMGVVPPANGFLQFLRAATERVGALLIFDEVITGFRVGLRGAQGLYGIDPDLSCFGKVIGGGFPVGAVGGKARFMDCLAPLGQVYQAGTLSGNPIAMQVGRTVLPLVQREGFYEMLEHKAARFARPIEEVLRATGVPAVLQRVGSMMTLFFGVSSVRNHRDVVHLDLPLFARFFQYLYERGIYIPPAPQEAWFISSAHTEEHLDEASHAIATFLSEL
jgi:glutamate-1-semialdehyde 2,1-aminomutase